MFCWRSSDELADMPRTDILRGIIAETLSAAAREILAVVERTVADYEEEASGFRQQIETQRRQLEVLQPHTKPAAAHLQGHEVVPDLQNHEVVPDLQSHEVVPDLQSHEVVPDLQSHEVVPNLQSHEVVPNLQSHEVVPDLQSHEVVPDLQSHEVVPNLQSHEVVPNLQSHEVVPDLQSHEVVPDLRSHEVVPDLQSHEVVPDLQSHEVVPDLQSHEVVPNLQSHEVVPDLQSHEVVPDLQSHEVVPDLQSHEVVPDLQSHEVVPDLQSHEVVPDLQSHEVVPNLQSHEVVPDLQSHEVVPNLQSHEVVPDQRTHEVVPDLNEEAITPQKDVENYGNLDFVWYNDGDDDDIGEEVDQLPAQPQTSSREKRSDLKDRDYQISSSVQSHRRPGRPRGSGIHRGPGGSLKRTWGRPHAGPPGKSVKPRGRETPETLCSVSSVKTNLDRPHEQSTHRTLRICMLEDSPSGLLAETVSQRSAVQDLVYPRTIREVDFLDLLRSTFPQLAGEDRKLIIYKSDRRRKLQRLRLETAEDIYRNLSYIGKTILYISLKTGEDEENEEEELCLLPTEEETLSTDTMQIDEDSPHSRTQLADAPDHIDLPILLLEDCDADVLSNNVLENNPVQDLRCHRGLQESDFLELLRCMFPQLDAGGSFELLMVDDENRLHPLGLRTLTPEQVLRAIRVHRKSALCIRLKTGKGPRSGSEEPGPPQEQADGVGSDSATPTGQTEVDSGWYYEGLNIIAISPEPGEGAAESESDPCNNDWKPNPEDVNPTETCGGRTSMEEDETWKRPIEFKTRSRRSWSASEKAAVQRQLGHFVVLRKVPGKEMCQKAMQAEPCLQSRTWTEVKGHVYNTITTLKRRQRR